MLAGKQPTPARIRAATPCPTAATYMKAPTEISPPGCWDLRGNKARVLTGTRCTLASASHLYLPQCAWLCAHLSECASRCALRASDVRMPTLGCTEARHPHARVGVCHTGPPLHICALPHLRLVHLTMNTLACLGCAQVHVPMRAHAGRPKTCGSLPSPANPPAAQFQAFSRLKGFNSLNCY